MDFDTELILRPNNQNGKLTTPGIFFTTVRKRSSGMSHRIRIRADSSSDNVVEHPCEPTLTRQCDTVANLAINTLINKPHLLFYSIYNEMLRIKERRRKIQCIFITLPCMLFLYTFTLQQPIPIHNLIKLFQYAKITLTSLLVT